MFVSHFLGLELTASDGVAGEVRDVYFDHAIWTVNYLRLETGEGLSRQDVLLPTAMVTWDAATRSLVTDATVDEIERSPDVNGDPLVSREAELLLGKYWQWTPSWTRELTDEMAANIESEATESTKRSMEALTRSHLRSAVEVRGYRIAATDKVLGDVEDFVINDCNWEIEGIVVDTRRWLPGRHVLIERRYLGTISWAGKTIAVDLPSGDIKQAEAPGMHERK
ncbi:MAG: PRC-barrel domain-containing protein [Candidatus Pacebacteria bacterium]|nr:PRC-barrel domain-containing protein [Candidatus Paceibacterota bacterium]